MSLYFFKRRPLRISTLFSRFNHNVLNHIARLKYAAPLAFTFMAACSSEPEETIKTEQEIATVAQPTQPVENKPINVIFDTDMAIDDWSALLLLGMNKNINVIGVMANGAGETRCGPAMANIPSLLDLTPSGDAVVACGDDYPLDGYFAFPEPWRVQADTLSGVAVKPSERPVSTKHAVEELHTLLNSYEDVVVLTTGSLTNIAQLIEKYPADIAKISRLVIMGGAFNVKGNIIVPGFTDGHPNTKAEWNIYVDPIAANQVFAADIPTEVVGLDVTNQVKVTTEFAQTFKESVQTPAAEFWDKVLDDNDWFIDSGEYYFWDVLAALVVIDPSYCEGTDYSVYVDYEFVDTASKWTLDTISELTVSGQPRKHLDPETAGVTTIGGSHPKVKICETTYADKAFAEFTATLNGLN